jgi:hypothetical protein
MTGSNGYHSSDPGFPALVEGVVEARNHTGIRVNGDWRNISKFRPIDLPDVGVRVRLGLDAKGFITSLEVVKDAPSHIGEAVSMCDDRDQRISRLAVLKAAALFGASRSDLKSGDVLRIADSWLAWVEQG